jgi:uncharacterized protein YprB with RNaseH-like and TPR domain
MIGFPDAYLDIETTGLYPLESRITVIGIYFCNKHEGKLVQLYDDKLTCKNLLKAMEGSDNMFTYNGSRFDVPFIRTRLGPDLGLMHFHTDLMNECWKFNLRGGFKAVLKRLCVSRETEGLNGLDAIWLWQRYSQNGDRSALDLLLRYNRDDVVNLKDLREKLALMQSATVSTA